MSNHQHADMPAKKVLARAIFIPTAITLGMAVYFATTGEWLLAGFMAVVSTGSLITYPWYKRQLAARDAAAAKVENTES
ncbi:hypothetical protein [Arthrobacter sp. zg-Y1110]|uniref:hypothetical protein n=1 Tax=Arthrobacter sp. zg-Y1110 TaxID=2886932 RepID=UPI001D14153D|nr:hypothetical protein [Arthrobacter sp. zg-Y1110]MCC3292966.1 hypothetical protein [Arthrobacter sp. zg-Y1110]UWX86905.1 hypothetical protein N2K99_18855 [Arthrobacter sp. zg-Y1110]